MPINDMDGKVVIITGANSGIGKETTLALSRMNAQVVMVCRNEKKGQEVLQEIKKEIPNGKIELMICDLSSQDSIRQFVTTFNETHDRLDVLINNAGVMLFKREVTPDGYENMFAINHLGPFLLTNLLLDKLKASAPSRIVIVASEAERSGKIDWDNLNLEKKFSGWQGYSQSKVAVLLFTYELAKKLDGTGVTVNALHPGVVRTNLAKSNAPWLFTLMSPLYYLFMISPEKGAQTSIYLASSPEVENVNGKYFSKCKPIQSSPITYDEASMKRLWDISASLTHLNET